MATWSTEELRQIAEADDLHISPFREDGVTYSTRPGFGPSSLATRSMCAPTAVRDLAGTRLRCGRRRGGSLSPA